MNKAFINCYISLGSNLVSEEYGQPADCLKYALQLLQQKDPENIIISKSSAVYFTEPQGYKEQPWFTNQVVELQISSTVQPLQLLAVLNEIEAVMGRQRLYDTTEHIPAQRFAPRCIDLDILLFADKSIVSETLSIPHPRMKERAFVLVPLEEITPDIIFPDGQTVIQALQEIEYVVKKENSMLIICQS